MSEPQKNTRAYGLLQERRIIDALRIKPSTVIELAELMGLTPGGVNFYLTRMRQQKRIRIADYIPNVTGSPMPVYGVGSSPDKEFVPARRRGKRPQDDRVKRVTDAILAALEVPHTVAELSMKLHRSRSVILTYLRKLRDPQVNRCIRICKWVQTGERNGWAPVYQIGSGRDKARPRALTPSEHHAKMRKDPEKLARETELRRQRDRIKRLRKNPHNPFSALGV